MAKSTEERVALRFIDQFGRIDFSPREFAYYLTRAGYVYQGILWKVVYHIVRNWAVDLEMGEDKGSQDYLRQTIHAAQILEVMDRQSNIIIDDEEDDDDEDWDL